MKTLHQYMSTDIWVEHYGGRCRAPKNPALGIEIEVEKANAGGALKWWDITGDGSLRDNGLEFITKGGVGFDDTDKAILEYLDYISKRKGFTHNYRTSIHVHINVAPLTVPQWQRLLMVYLMVEGTFYRMGGEWRRSSPYCIPVSESAVMFDRVMSAITYNVTDSNSFMRCINKFNDVSNKYCGLGLFRMKDLCTVELRMHEGTNEATRISALMEACKSLYDIATNDMDIKYATDKFIDIYDPDISKGMSERGMIELWQELSSSKTPAKKQKRKPKPIAIAMPHGFDVAPPEPLLPDDWVQIIGPEQVQPEREDRVDRAIRFINEQDGE